MRSAQVMCICYHTAYTNHFARHPDNMCVRHERHRAESESRLRRRAIPFPLSSSFLSSAQNARVHLCASSLGFPVLLLSRMSSSPRRSSSSRPNPPRSSRPSSLSFISSSFSISGLSSDPGSPTGDQDELEAALIAARSMPRLILEPATSPETEMRHSCLPTSLPRALSSAVASPSHPAAKRLRGGSVAAKKGKGKEKAPEGDPAQKLFLLSHLHKPAPSFWASLAASSLASATSAFSGTPSVPSPSISLLSALSSSPATTPSVPSS
ncbi:hypothetical protein EDB19DRAFT_905028 [Suillus lakei]|nr:hypothetical protein EDB19DRAFT_905028 [Suillus lakei]